MAETEPKKRGFFAKLFGLGNNAPVVQPAPEPVVEIVPEPLLPTVPEPVVEALPELVADATPPTVEAEVTAQVSPPVANAPKRKEAAPKAAPPKLPAAPQPVQKAAAPKPARPEARPLPPLVEEPVLAPEPPAPVSELETAPVSAVEIVPELVIVSSPAAEVTPPVPVVPETLPVAVPAAKKSWWRRLSDGLSRTSSALTTGITDIFTKRKLDAATLEELEDILIQADLGVDTAMRVAKAVSAGRYDKEISADEVKAILAREVAAILTPVAQPLVIDATKKPFVILMVGVNGSGKTTTIGKLAAKFRAEKRSVVMAAGDTFRAAAIEQLKVWAERTGAGIVAREQGADAAGLAFDALKQASEQGTDVVLVDTAGRLQNKAGLMEELGKVVRVMKKLDPTAPHATLLVLDATVGQNAISQVEAFRETAGVTGLVMTKLDGTARGGILVALAAKFGLPVHFIGVGESVEDLEPFSAQDFARAVSGLNETTRGAA
ncbi:MAG: signal recognition particle-docking protein FtsY [Bosea sp. (in: a-proteobacteria)]